MDHSIELRTAISCHGGGGKESVKVETETLVHNQISLVQVYL
jgi:hypothetical protein